FGLSGTVFQTLLRNPLASPDVIGVTLGSSAGAVIAMAFFQADGRALFWFALLGGLATAVLLLAVAGTGGPGASGGADNRFVLVGIGVAAALTALISYLLTRLSLKTAGDALHWMIGSLSASTWDRAAVLAGALAVLVPLLGLLVARLRILQLGDDTATSLGLAVPRTRTSLVLVAVALSALTVGHRAAVLRGVPGRADRAAARGPPQLPAVRRGRRRDRAAGRHRRAEPLRGHPAAGRGGHRRARRPVPDVDAHPLLDLRLRKVNRWHCSKLSTSTWRTTAGRSSATSAWPCPRSGSRSSWAPTAAASRPCCAACPACSPRRAAASCWTGATCAPCAARSSPGGS